MPPRCPSPATSPAAGPGARVAGAARKDAVPAGGAGGCQVGTVPQQSYCSEVDLQRVAALEQQDASSATSCKPPRVSLLPVQAAAALPSPSPPPRHAVLQAAVLGRGRRPARHRRPAAVGAAGAAGEQRGGGGRAAAGAAARGGGGRHGRCPGAHGWALPPAPLHASHQRGGHAARSRGGRCCVPVDDTCCHVPPASTRPVQNGIPPILLCVFTPPILQLACHDGLSLLHRAVQSGCGATLAAVLGWGEEAGAPWRCDLAGGWAATARF